MRTWIKNGARMTILVTAFAGAGAGVAFAQGAAARAGAGHAIVRLVSHRGSCAADGCAVIQADRSEEGTASAGPLGSILGLGQPSVPYATGTEDANDPLAVPGVDAPEENTPSTSIAGSDEGRAGTGAPGKGHHRHHGGGPGPGTGHRHHHHSGGAVKGRHHGGGGQGASSGASSANAAAASGSLPTTGAPLAGLLGLAVVAIGAGLFLRQRSKRGEDDQPQED